MPTLHTFSSILFAGVLTLLAPLAAGAVNPATPVAPVSSYILGDSIAYGLQLDGLQAKLKKALGGPSHISFDGGRSLTTPGNQIKKTAFESVDEDQTTIAAARVIVIVLGMNPQETSFANSQQQLMAKLKTLAPEAQYFWVDIGATIAPQVPGWNARNKTIYDNAASLGYTVISRYKAIFGACADPLNITPGQNFPGWVSEPGYGGPGNVHGLYAELSQAILNAVTHAPAAPSCVIQAAGSSYVLGDSIAYGLHLDQLAAKLTQKLGGTSKFSYDVGRSITTPGTQIQQSALESVERDKAYIAGASVIIVALGTNQQEESFAQSQQLLMQRLKALAPQAKYYWIDIGATLASQVPGWNARNKTIYDNATSLGYTVISRYKSIFGSQADPLNIKPGQNFPGWVTEPGYGEPGNVHGLYGELSQTILNAVSNASATRAPVAQTAGSSYVLGASIVYGLHLNQFASKLEQKLGGTAKLSYDLGRSITTPGTQIQQSALESVERDKAYIAGASVIIVALGTNQQEESFAQSQQLLMQRLKALAPQAKYYWIDIGATLASQVPGWNTRNKTIYDNASSLGYTVISRYKSIFGPQADPLNIQPGQNFPGLATEPGYGEPGNVHGFYTELSQAILSAL